MTLIPKPNNSKTISDFLITKYLPDMLVYDHTTPQSGCFWTEAGGRKRNLFYISKLTEPEYDNLVLQNIDISQQYTGWKKKKRLGFKRPLYLILLTCCHNKGLNFSQTSHIAHYQDFDSHPAENEWLCSVMCHRIQSPYQQLHSWTQIWRTR